VCTACKPLNGTGPGHTVNEKESEEGQEQRARTRNLAVLHLVFSTFHLMYICFFNFCFK